MRELVKVEVVASDEFCRRRLEHIQGSCCQLDQGSLAPAWVNESTSEDLLMKYRLWLWDQLRVNNREVVVELDRLVMISKAPDGLRLYSAAYPNPSYVDIVAGCIRWLAEKDKALSINQVYTGDAIELINQVPDASVDLIFTDPPYLKNCMWLYGWLAKEATRVLKPNGFLMAYIGTYWKCEAMALLREHLDYFWDYTIIHGGDCPLQRNRRTRARTKSILCYVLKGSKALPKVEVWGAFEGKGKSKQWHEWGQHQDEAMYYIDCFTKPGDLVLDPFFGGGTTAIACEMIGRNWLGFEIDAVQANIARQRLKGADN